MNKNLYKFAVASTLFGLVGCNLISSDEKTEVASADNLPTCSTQKGLSGTNNIGVKMYVEKEDAYYVCTESGWKVSNSSDVIIAGSELSIKNATVTGSINALGPIAICSPVEIRELAYSPATESFKYTGFIVTDSSINNSGDYVSPKVNFYSPYVEVTANGVFKDAVTGEDMEDSLELKAFANLESSQEVKVSVYSTLVAARIKRLVNSDYNFDAAVLQANKEIMQNFGFKASDNLEAIALGVAILLRGHPDDTKTTLSEMIGNMSKDFASDGKIQDDAAMVKFADYAFNLEYLKYRDEDTDEPLLKLSDIRNNLENWSNDSVPAFESVLTRFWNHIYGLEKCSAAKKDVVQQNAATTSDSAETYFTCDMTLGEGAWRLSTLFERDTVGLGNDEDGALSTGNGVLDTTYIFDTTGTGIGEAMRWKYADSITIVIGEGCSDNEDVLESFQMTKDKNKNNNFYVCKDRQWVPTDTTTYVIGYLCNKELVDTPEKYGKNEDKKFFRCKEVAEDVFMWYPTTEEIYMALDAKADCDTTDFVKVDKANLVCTDYEKYEFRKANELEEEVSKPCTPYNIGKKAEDSKSASYTCGCSVYDMDAMAYVTVTEMTEDMSDLSKCHSLINPPTWIKD
ncbi:MAG: hypothetical protein HUK20_07985 [Fibrobacter sp.]|nr:hypothetical protein [Fibrobacter sp.]